MAKKKQQIPKYIINKFKKPQFKLGDIVTYSFLGESGRGKIIKIKNEKADHYVSYTVKGKDYIYPCGLKIKEHKSYQFGYILYEETKDNIGHDAITGGQIDTTTNDFDSSERTPGTDIPVLSKYAGSGSSKTNDDRSVVTDNSIANNESGTTTRDTKELESAIEKQKRFLQGFIKK